MTGHDVFPEVGDATVRDDQAGTSNHWVTAQDATEAV